MKSDFNKPPSFKWLTIWGLVAPTLLQALPQVTAVLPRQNEINVAMNSAVEVTFSEDMNPASLNAATWLIYGGQTGFYSGSFTYDAASRTARFSPSVFFKEGEIVYVVLTANIENAAGQTLSSAFQWSFTVAVEFGTGVFDKRIEIPVGENERDPIALFAADFNNDQFVDLAVANNATNTVSILINQFFSLGGSFSLDRIFSAGNGPTSLTGGDFNEDGFVDLAVVNFHDNTVTIHTNDKTGAFFPSQTITTAQHPVYAEAQDYNNDGHVDLSVLIFGVNQFQLFLSQGNGSFDPTPRTFATGASPQSLASGDFDNDGDLDIVVTNSGDNSISVFKNDGAAQFTLFGETAVQEAPTIVRSNDLVGRSDNQHYGDGFLDLVLVHSNNNSLTVLDNRSRDGSFVVYQEMNAGIRPLGLFIGDVDTTDAIAAGVGLGKDHDLDLAVSNLFSQDVYLWINELNNNFSNQSSNIFAAGSTPVAITGGDFDRDGDIDLAVTNLGTQSVSILLNKGGQSGSIRFGDPASVLDFGEVYVGSDSTRTFRILNPGSEVATVDEISTSNPVFTVSDSQAVIPPGTDFEFSITFSPLDTVLYQEALTIRSDAFVSQPTRRIGLRGRGIKDFIAVNPDTLNFGVVIPPQTRTLPIEIVNGGRGALTITDMQFTNAVFSTSVKQFTIPPQSRQQVDITFAPQSPVAYLDTLTIFNSDLDNPQVPVILIGSGSNQFPPRITSADTVTATEDVFFEYTATAIDSDGTLPQFLFRDLPVWLATKRVAADNNVVEGTPREGDRDTSFVVVATDGLFSDTLSVYVRVLPVNDPPVISPIADQFGVEQTLLTFNLSAFDPEDSTLAFTAQGLPAGAIFTDNGDKTASFTWTPPVGSAGVYAVTFIVTEVVAQNALSDTATVQITIKENLPDLVASLQITDSNVSLNQTRLLTGTVRDEVAPVDTSFRLTFFYDGNFVKDTLITKMSVGQEVSFAYLALFDRLGTHEITFAVDWNKEIAESNEDNNNIFLRLQVTKGDLVVRPNPFTPNNDGFNDRVRFDFGRLVLNQPRLKIFDFNGVLLRTIEQPRNRQFLWDGLDSKGHEQKPGVYLYILTDRHNRISSGYVVLAR